MQPHDHVCFLFRTTTGRAGAIVVSSGAVTFEGETAFAGNSARDYGGE